MGNVLLLLLYITFKIIVKSRLLEDVYICVFKGPSHEFFRNAMKYTKIGDFLQKVFYS